MDERRSNPPRPARRRVLWIAAAGVWVLVGFVGLHSHMMTLGAAHHDARCTDH